MIYILEMDIPNRDKWGATLTKEFVLPSKIHRIKGVLANVKLSLNTYYKRSPIIGQQYIATDEYKNFGLGNGRIYRWYDGLSDIDSVQVGNISLALNNSDIVCSNVPLNVLSELRKSDYNHNKVMVDNRINAGSLLRVTLEEVFNSPFLSEVFLTEQDKDYNSKADQSGVTWNLSTLDVVNYVFLAGRYQDFAIERVERGETVKIVNPNFTTKEGYLAAYNDTPSCAEFFQRPENDLYHSLAYLYFGSDTIPTITNSYTVKIYLDYD